MSFQNIHFLIPLLFIAEVNGYDIIDNNCTVYRELCFSQKYDFLEPPTKPKVLFNMLTNKDAVKQVNEHTMTIRFEPTYILLWEDPRLDLVNQTFFEDEKDVELIPLPDALIHRLWSPKITINNLFSKRTNSFIDPANYGTTAISDAVGKLKSAEFYVMFFTTNQ